MRLSPDATRSPRWIGAFEHFGPTRGGGTLLVMTSQFLLLTFVSGLVAVGRADPIPLIGHTRGVCDAAFPPESDLLASGSDDGTVQLWSLENRTTRAILEHGQPVRFVRFLGSERLLTATVETRDDVYDSQCTLFLWDIATKGTIWRSKVVVDSGQNGNVVALCVSDSANAFAALVEPFDASNEDVQVQAWQGRLPKAAATFVVTRKGKYSRHRESPPCFAMQGKRLVFAGKIATKKRMSALGLTIVDAETWKETSSIALGGAVGTMVAAPRSSSIAAEVMDITARREGRTPSTYPVQIQVWDIATGQQKAQTPVFGSFSASRYIASGKAQHSIGFVNSSDDLGMHYFGRTSADPTSPHFVGIALLETTTSRVLPVRQYLFPPSHSIGWMPMAAFSCGNSTGNAQPLVAFCDMREELLYVIDPIEQKVLTRLELPRQQQIHVSWLGFSPNGKYLVAAASPMLQGTTNAEIDRWRDKLLVYWKFGHSRSQTTDFEQRGRLSQ